MTPLTPQAGDLNVFGAAQLARVCDDGEARRGQTQGRLDLIADGAVAVRDGRIVAVGSTADVRATFGDPDVPTIDAGGRTVLPGLVESHSHPVFAPVEFAADADTQSLDQIAGKEDGIMATVVSTENATDDELRSALRTFYAKIIAGGATTLEVKSGYGLSVEGELRALRLLRASRADTSLNLVTTFLGAHMKPEGAESSATYMTSVLDEMLPLVRAEGLADFIDVSCDAGLFDTGSVERLLTRAKEVGMPARVHADGWAAADGWRIAAANGAAAADHLTYTSDAEILEVGATTTVATLLPVAELVYLCDRRANARLLIDQRVPVAIATDYCSTIHSTSLVATVGMSVPWFDITPSEAIVGATLNAAYSLNVAADCGSLDVGKRGDLTILDCRHPNEVYLAFNAPLVSTVVINGVPCYG